MNKKEKLTYLIKRISKNRNVEAIILFGSQINGRARKDSDIDLAIITKKISRDKELDIIGLGDDTFNISIFHRLPLIIQFRVLKEGKIILLKNPLSLHKERTKVLRNYLDFAPFINKFYQRKLNGI